MIVDPNCSLEKSLRKSSVVHSKSSLSWEPGFWNQYMRTPWQSLSRTRDCECNASFLSMFTFDHESLASSMPTLFVEGKVEGNVIVELKAAKAIAPQHQAQIINYLKATGIEVGRLINFGNPKLEYKRFTRHQCINQRIESILNILSIHVHSCCSKNYASVLT